ncbi:MAG: hypothetical protein RJA49_975 [Actinomycetota bacterium]
MDVKRRASLLLGHALLAPLAVLTVLGACSAQPGMSTLGDSPLKMTISYGKGRMPAFGGLSQDQVDALVAYLRGQ